MMKSDNRYNDDVYAQWRIETFSGRMVTGVGLAALLRLKAKLIR
jgi:hypothetical protein